MDLRGLGDSIRRCFVDLHDTHLLNMFRIVVSRGSPVLTDVCFMKHRIIPLGLLKRNELKSIQDNIVYLSPQDYLRVHVLLYHYFYRHKDGQMLQAVIDHLRYIMKDDYLELTSTGDFSKKTYMKFEMERTVGFRNMG